MITKDEIRRKALEIGFGDAGFAGVEPFTSQLDYIAVDDRYRWTERMGLTLVKNIDPGVIMENCRTLIVLLYSYFTASAPVTLERHYGRCYLNDDRVTKNGLSLMVKEFRSYLRNNGIDTKSAVSMPEKLSAMRAGVGTCGRNTLLYASNTAGGSSFVFPVVLLTDREFEPDAPSVKNGCPDWCRNACIAACPTRALTGNGRIDPSRCISYLSYYGEGATPPELREPMGLSIYGCDRCQNVCPRNTAWITSGRPGSEKLETMAEDFAPERILLMDREYFENRIFPFMFYMKYEDAWRWRMNAARAMGNSGDRKYIPYLVEGYKKYDDARVRSLIAWALGRLGGDEAAAALKEFIAGASGELRAEIESAIASCPLF